MRIKVKADGVVKEVGDEEGQKLIDSGEAELAPVSAEQNADVDENGVPWKNRAKEFERKYGELQEQIDTLKEQQAAAQQRPQQEEEAPWKTEARKLAQEEMRAEKVANTTMDRLLDKMEIEEALVKDYRSEIEAELSGYSRALRTNETAIRKICKEIIGNHTSELLAKARKAKEQTPEPIGTGLSSAGAPGGEEIELSAEEISFDDKHQLSDKGFTKSEIREMYKKRNKK